MPVTAMNKRDRSLYIGVCGLGQAGSRIAETFYSLGYKACAINSATQDLEYISLPNNNKLFLPYALGGCAKELENGKQSVEQNSELILEKLKETFDDTNEMLILAISGAGGQGSGGAKSMIQLMLQLNKPVGVIFILPMATDDALSKHNAITTLGELAKLASSDVIAPLIIVDNAKIELLYSNLSKAEFWTKANSAIVEPLHMFNHLSSMPTNFDSVDPMDFSRLLLVGDCTVLGEFEVRNFTETTALAEATMNNLETSLLASDFNLKEARSGGIIVTGSKKALQSLPSENLAT